MVEIGWVWTEWIELHQDNLEGNKHEEIHGIASDASHHPGTGSG